MAVVHVQKRIHPRLSVGNRLVNYGVDNSGGSCGGRHFSRMKSLERVRVVWLIARAVTNRCARCKTKFLCRLGGEFPLYAECRHDIGDKSPINTEVM